MSDEAPAGFAMQLKRYTIAPGRWDEWQGVWRRVAALRLRCGFAIPFVAADRDAALFTWAISHPRFAEGAARYYADPERQQLSSTDYDPATGAYFDSGRDGAVERCVAAADIRFVTPVPLPQS